jgi:hypothetical protein
MSHYLTDLGEDQSIRPWMSHLVGGFNSYSRSILTFENQFRGCVYPVLSTIVLIGICLNHGRLGESTLLNLNFDDNRFPIKAAEFIDKGIPEGNLMTTDYWGGYVIYRFYPQIKVFFDGRNDMYGREFFKEYEELINLDHSWKSTLSKYKIQWVLLPVEFGLSSALKELPEWQVIYDDHQAIIFLRRR